jgi:GNAT superfamily N-acetyltransferase
MKLLRLWNTATSWLILKFPFHPSPPPPALFLNQFFEKITIEDDTVNGFKNGWITSKYYQSEEDRRHVGYVRYKLFVGQIGLFFIDQEYQKRGLGKQILEKAMTG